MATLFLILTTALIFPSLVQCQLSKTGACPAYQTDRTFDAQRVANLTGQTYYLTHALPSPQESNITCAKLTFNHDHTFKYSYTAVSGTTLFYDGSWSAYPATLHSPGQIILQFPYKSYLGATSSGKSTLYVLFQHPKLLVLASCRASYFDVYHEEFLFSFATKSIAMMKPFFEEQKKMLIEVNTPNAFQLLEVPQNEECSH